MSIAAIFIALAMILGGLIWLLKIWAQKTQPKGWEMPVAAIILILGILKIVFKL